MRYVVLDTGDDREATEVAGHRGRPIGEFCAESSAMIIALQRLARGNRGVVVVDTATGRIVFPFAGARCEQSSPGVSGTRRILPAPESRAAVGAAFGRKGRW